LVYLSIDKNDEVNSLQTIKYLSTGVSLIVNVLILMLKLQNSEAVAPIISHP